MNKTIDVLSATHEVSLETATGKINGTLDVPAGEGPFPVALLIAGSGPTDRDGNSKALPGRNDSLKLLAGELMAHGVASLRYDKRGVGESAAAKVPEKDIRFGTFVDDAVAWMSFLKSDRDFKKIIVIGHSEGSLIGMLAAERAGADAFISLEGAGEAAQEIMLKQLQPQLPPPLFEKVKELLSKLAAGEVAGNLPDEFDQLPALANLFKPEIQPYLISWFKFDPAQVLAQLEIPVLIVQGTTDLQVDESDARRLANANPRAQLVIIEGMCHVLKDAPLDRAANLAAYSNPNLPLAKGLVGHIMGFLDGNI